MTVRKFRLLPEPAVRPFAYSLPWIELATGVALLSGLYPRPAALLTLSIFLVFAGAIAWAIRKKINTSCDCFGLLYRERVGWITLGRDGALVICTLLVFWFDGADWGRVGFRAGYTVWSSSLLLIAYLLPLYFLGRLLPARVGRRRWSTRSQVRVDGS